MDSATQDGSEPQSPPLARIIVFDPHPIIQTAVEKSVRAEPNIQLSGMASTISNAEALVEMIDPDVLIAEINEAGRPNFRFVREMARRRNIRVIIYTVFDEAVNVHRSLLAGASAYVLKSEPTAAVIEAVRAALQGTVYLSGAVLDRLHQDGGDQTFSDEIFRLRLLTSREFQVFRLIGRGLTTKKLASSLDITESTAASYRRRIKSKLGMRSIPTLTRFAVQYENASEA